ncbi:MAG: hypothetical protein Q7T25_06555 [Sideroxyarcus sp.]|nr:hypothetical protein [Sideroxyarcus sp.]
MRLHEIAEKLGLECLTPEIQATKEVDLREGYASDLLSDVLANAPHGGVLVTVQVHLNVIAVAMHAELAAIIFASGRVPDVEVREKAVEEGIVLYVSQESAFDVVGKLYNLGIRGHYA